jgi:hypothetical protein
MKTVKLSKTVQKFADLLDYNPETGIFYWKERGVKSFDTMYAGQEAGSYTDGGYVRICVNGKTYMAHRLAVALTTGKMPRSDRPVHHKNKNRSDNSASNVVECTYSENATSTFNKGRGRTSLRGVSFCKQTGMWLSRVRKNGKTNYIGRFRVKTHAGVAYDKLASVLHGEFATLNFS